MNVKKTLTESQFLEQISKYGFLPENLPHNFNSDSFANKIGILSKKVPKKVNYTAPTTISYYKSDVSRRIMSIPNPESFLRVALFIKKDWEKVLNYAESENSTSSIIFIHGYNDVINSENFKRINRTKSTFIDNLKRRTKLSMGYSYQLNVDITRFYDTVYTHSITWAICGKENAKKYFRESNGQKPADYEWADSFDKNIRSQKNGETNGIITGPFTSRIFSEIILAAIDAKLREEKLFFSRYVDDYQFYFSTKTDAESNIPLINRILKEYGLNVNELKTSIKEFPFETYTSLPDEIKNAGDNVKCILSKAISLQKEGFIGAHKYAVKSIKDKTMESNDADFVVPILINMMLLDPNLGSYVVEFLKKNENRVNKQELTVFVNREISLTVPNHLQQETLTLMSLCKELSLLCNPDNINKVLQKGDDLSIIMALDIWRQCEKKASKEEIDHIDNTISNLITELTREGYSSSRWLLIHEIKMHQLIKIPLIINTPGFFSQLEKHNVSFYKE